MLRRAAPRCVQDMLARTQALEGRLLALNAERNELEAESARMPSHTAGRTLQVHTHTHTHRRLRLLGAGRPACWGGLLAKAAAKSGCGCVLNPS